jgi:hypothetical protein
MQLSREQQDEALELIESLAWGDLDHSIRDQELALRLALEATRDSFDDWLIAGGDSVDEFSIPTRVLNTLSHRERLAYVARLLRTIALHYGVDSGSNDRPSLLDVEKPHSPARLLHGLNDIV